MATAAYVLLVYFLLSGPNLLNVYHSTDETQDLVQSSTKPTYIQNRTEEFDFVIIGGGSAGAVLANRLSRRAGITVLLLERGGTPTPLSSVPYLWRYLVINDATPNGSVTRYLTVPQPNFSGASNGVVPLAGGRVLGGSSTLNAMLYIRGSPGGYDEWAEITGDRSWSYDSILPFFKKSEDYHGLYDQPVDKSVHSTNGEFYIGRSYQPEPASKIFFDAVREKNIPIKDLNAEGAETGFQAVDMNMKHGKRWGTYEAFIQPVLARSNLQVYSYSTATKIHLDNSNKAYGVTYTRHGQTRFVKARKEIIVSAGAFESPKLLMLSGIGPSTHLKDLGIETLVDLPVGQNFQDHIAVNIQVRFNQNITFVPERDFTEETQVQYILNSGGPLLNTVSVLGFTSTVENNNPKWPDIQYFINHQTDALADLNSLNKTRPDKDFVSIFLVKSDSPPGEVRLNSSNPMDKPIVDPKYLTTQSDFRRLREGVKYIVDLYENSNTYGAVGGARLEDSYFPANCKALPVRSDDYWDCVIRYLSSSGFHATSTCPMGKSIQDSKAVVDSKLRVFGTTGLRVIDASVMPRVTNANTNAPSIMIGEKGADFILRQWGLLSLTDLLTGKR